MRRLKRIETRTCPRGDICVRGHHVDDVVGWDPIKGDTDRSCTQTLSTWVDADCSGTQASYDWVSSNEMNTDKSLEEMKNGEAWIMTSGNLEETNREVDNNNVVNDDKCGGTFGAMCGVTAVA